MDGNSYAEDEFVEWYGPEYRDAWDSASPSGQDEQTAGAAEHNTSAAQSTHAVELCSSPMPRLSPWPALGQEIWSFIVEYLMVSPTRRDNGIARANRFLNIRWRVYHRVIFREALKNIIRWVREDDGDMLLNLIDLQDITP